MHIKKPKGSSMISVIESNVKHENHGHGHMGSNGGVLHNNGMSLFQDLKLKRRKVDSRCSSDGESVGTSDSSAASLSPDTQAQGDGSPKEKDRLTPEECGPPPVLASDLTKGGFPPDAFIFMIKAERERVVKESNVKVFGDTLSYPPINTNSVIKLTNGHVNNGLTPNAISPGNGTTGNLIIVKSEPSDDDDGTEMNALSLTCKSTRESNGSDKSLLTNGVVTLSPVPSPQRPRKSPFGRNSSSRPNSFAGSDNESTGSRSSCKSQKKLIVDEEMGGNTPPPLISRLRDPNSPPGQNSNSNSSSTSGVGLSPQSSVSGSSSVIFKHHQGSRLSPNSTRVPSPLNHHPHLQMMGSHQLLGNHNHLHTRLTTGSLLSDPRASLREPSTMVQAELRNLAEKPDPLSVVTSTSLSFHHHSMYRINGVRPEVISGGAVTPTSNNSPNGGSYTGSPPHQQVNGPIRKSPNHPSRSPNGSPQSNSGSSVGSILNGSIHSPGSNTIVAGGSLGLGTTSSNGGANNHHHVNLNRTPTVIMGEAGGVRTMLWSQNLPSDLGISSNGNSTPNSNGHYNLPPQANGNSLLPNGHTSPPHHNNNLHLAKGGLSMERLWASEALNLSTGPGSNMSSGGASNSNGTGSPYGTSPPQNGHFQHQHHHVTNSNPEDDEYEQPMICMICEDRATGLHYGIITCEGCKGFFKRTVQNRRVYTCVADGTCEITKAQRNRCQYCRFKKCIEQGMVLQAVREDRMPGGRNSGAVYNLYKVPVKYRKHKKGNRGVGGAKGEKLNTSNNNMLNCDSNGMTQAQTLGPASSSQSISGTILKAALTSPNEVIHMRQGIPFEQAAGMITHLVQCDNFHDIAALQNWEELLEGRGDLSEKLCQMGDSIVYRLVQWTKRLPFYQEVPVDVHTRVLTQKWHELLVLTTSAWQAMYTPGPPASLTAEDETMENIQILQRCLQAMMGRSLTLEQLRQDVGQMVERLTYLTRSFRRLGIRLEEYVTLKVIAMLQKTGTKSNEVAVIKERYIKCLRTFVEVTCPSHPNRLNDLLRTLPEVQAAASLLLESKMFYVPFLLNSALLQR